VRPTPMGEARHISRATAFKAVRHLHGNPINSELSAILTRRMRSPSNAREHRGRRLGVFPRTGQDLETA
jgi:hypothetical protein